MALIKPIKQKNGVILNYHRIYDIKNVVNDKTYINIYSYLNEEERNKEKEQTETEKYSMDIYINISIESMEYNDTLTIEDAYEYLKTLEVFEGSEDI